MCCILYTTRSHIHTTFSEGFIFFLHFSMTPCLLKVYLFPSLFYVISTPFDYELNQQRSLASQNEANIYDPYKWHCIAIIPVIQDHLKVYFSSFTCSIGTSFLPLKQVFFFSSFLLHHSNAIGWQLLLNQELLSCKHQNFWRFYSFLSSTDYNCLVCIYKTKNWSKSWS